MTRKGSGTDWTKKRTFPGCFVSFVEMAENGAMIFLHPLATFFAAVKISYDGIGHGGC